MALYTIQNLSFTYPKDNQASECKHALQNVNLTIDEGEWVILCGKSGSGKSTLLRHLKPEVTPYGEREGSVQYEGLDVWKLEPRRRASEIGFLYQDPDNQIVTDKVWHELAFGLENLGCQRETIRVRVAEISTYFGIQHWFDKKVAELSGGQKQILNLAAVMALQPKVLVLDEPTAGLDPMAAIEFHGMLERIHQDLGVTVVMSEQRLEGVVPYADRLVVLDGGRVLLNGKPSDVGKRLQGLEHGVFLTMPTPMRIYAGVESEADCPLTVREARDWLKREMNGEPVRVGNRTHPDQRGNVTKKDSHRVPSNGKRIIQKKNKAIELKDVRFRYQKNGEDVLRGLNFHVIEGTVTAVVGGNGTGKTTMLHVLCGIYKPYSGKRMIFGKEEVVISYLPQSPSTLFAQNTVWEELEDITKEASRLQEVASWMKLEDIRDKHPFDVSGGEKQRVALAKVLLTDPDILLLDEPTKGMDAEFKEELGNLLTTLKEKGKTILMVSHDIEFCARHSEYMALMFQGQISVMDETREVLSGNGLYTTAANKMAREYDRYAITAEDVIRIWKERKLRK